MIKPNTVFILFLLTLTNTACSPSKEPPKINYLQMDSLVVREQKQRIIYTQAPDLIIIKAYNVNIKSLETLDKEIVTIEAKPIGGMLAIEQLILFPDLAKRARIEGDLVADLNVDKFGSIHEIKVLKSLGGGIEEAVIDALNKTKFSPAKRNKENVSCRMRIRIQFSPPDGGEDLIDRKEPVKLKSRKL